MEMPSKSEALYRTMHNMNKNMRNNNWGLLMMRYWLAHLPVKPSDILVVGCGNGKTCKYLVDVGHTVTGLDIVPGPYNRDGYEFVLHDLESGSMPFADKQFDVVMCFDVMEHLEPDKVQEILGDIFRVAKKVIFGIPLLHPTEGKPLLKQLHKTVRPAHWWIERLDNRSLKLANKYMTLVPDSRDGMFGTNKLIFIGESK